MTFTEKPTATLKARSSTSNETLSVAGITTAAITPETAAEQTNKILGIVGKGIAADKNMKRIRTEEAL